ncbi:hypothetical protein TEA_000595 [Camellia sinensis var. sinensis]|uniref:Uncharacterized protein n=1 Tax=Camellia sinensis var. sinensis TaxID=542762 RepID=A0A4S4DLP8_CAMSN|nr:hypothetical protein TEA_000595 [Camellia sinensis var. sinensis]
MIEGMDGNGGGIVFSENLKKERLRKLSVVGRVSSSNENGEMGSVGSDREDELRPTTSISKRFKLPTKFFDEYNTVDHASVPRKLRSAMKKRNHNSISPPLPDKKKPNNGINGVKLPIKNSIKKSKQKQQRDSEGSPSQIIVRPITKDEEEVVETLYALAEMFPFPNNNKSDSDCELTKAKSSPMREGENSRPRLEGSEAPEKEEDSNSKSLGPSTTVEAGNSSLLEESAQETVQAKCLNEPSEPGFPNSAQLRTELDNTISQRNIQSMSMLSKSEPIDGNPSCSSVGCNVQSELGLGTSSKQPKHKEAATYAGKPENAAGPAASVGCQHELQHTLNGSKNSGVALWPGLSSAASNGASTQGPSLRSSPAKTPVWLAMAPSVTPPGSLRNGVLTEKDSRAPVGRNKPWKRCSAHVYNPIEVRNAILLHKGLIQEHQQQASSTSTLYTTQKKSFDFLSLSARGGGMEATNSANKVGNELEPLTQFQIPYLPSLAQNHTVLPYSLPQIRYSSTPFTNNLSVASAKQNGFAIAISYFSHPNAVHMHESIDEPCVQIQPLQYMSHGPPRLSTAALPIQQRQRIWTAQYKPVGVAGSYNPNWENRRQDPSTIQFAQSIVQRSHCSLEVLGPKYAPISQHQQQQQQFNPVSSSLPNVRAKGQHHHHHLPSGYEGSGVCLCPDTALPLQLLCNERP